MLKATFAALIVLFVSFTASALPDFDQLNQSLKTTGLKGEIHGANAASNLYVFTFRNPNDFFDYQEFPLTSEDVTVLSQLPLLKRNQVYLVKGEFLDNGAPIRHINASSLELVQDYTSEVDQYPYVYRGNVDDLKNADSFTGRVHAVGENGSMLVMEYIDRIVPVIVTESETQALVNQLFKGDLLTVHYRAKSFPNAPLHITLKTKAQLQPGENAFDILQSIQNDNQQNLDKIGYLIKFPKSPLISIDVYALLVEDAGGSSIQYTLTNFDDPDLFKQIRLNCETIWNENPAGVQNGRNKLVNRKVKVHAKGIGSVVDPSQANPQILIQSINDLSFEIVN